MKSSAILAAVAALAVGSAQACVESNASQFGTTIKNNCPKAVHVTYCFGKGCTPPDDGLFMLNPGIQKQVSSSNKAVRYVYCIHPEKLVDGRCRK
jgi:hypothetical protein